MEFVATLLKEFAGIPVFLGMLIAFFGPIVAITVIGYIEVGK